MPQLNETLQSNLAVVVAALATISLLLLLIVVVQGLRLRRVGRRLDGLTRGSDGRSIEGVLADHLDSVFRVSGELSAVRLRVADLESVLPVTFRGVGLVRFNPFQDTGGNQSFALALLTAQDNGFVVSSLHSRAGTRVYAKEIKAGKCDTALSIEEQQAVERAQSLLGAQPAVARTAPLAQPAISPTVPAPATPTMARRVAAAPAAPVDPPIDAGFLERRLRGEDDGDSVGLWGDRSRS